MTFPGETAGGVPRACQSFDVINSQPRPACSQTHRLIFVSDSHQSLLQLPPPPHIPTNQIGHCRGNGAMDLSSHSASMLHYIRSNIILHKSQQPFNSEMGSGSCQVITYCCSTPSRYFITYLRAILRIPLPTPAHKYRGSPLTIPRHSSCTGVLSSNTLTGN